MVIIREGLLKICLICRRLLELEEEMIQTMCADIVRVKPDVVVTEKGVSDLAQHFLVKAGISVIRRVRKTDNNRIARLETCHRLNCLKQGFIVLLPLLLFRATGAIIVNQTSEIKEEDIGTKCGLFEVSKIGDELVLFCFVFYLFF